MPRYLLGDLNRPITMSIFLRRQTRNRHLARQDRLPAGVRIIGELVCRDLFAGEKRSGRRREMDPLLSWSVSESMPSLRSKMPERLVRCTPMRRERDTTELGSLLALRVLSARAKFKSYARKGCRLH
jgi:hypothetical protein